MSRFRAGVLTFPGSNCDHDIVQVLREFFDARVDLLWHRDSIAETYDLLVVPGGFSFGDYLRAGAMARVAPAMNSLKGHAEAGRPVLGICNGFQILCEAGLLPGALVRNISLKHICKTVQIKPAGSAAFTEGLDPARSLSIPVSHSDGNYRIDDDGLAVLQDRGGIAFRYDDNPNGSVFDIAGVVNAGGNVLGMMPHPERAVDPLTGGQDGRVILERVAALAAGVTA